MKPLPEVVICRECENVAIGGHPLCLPCVVEQSKAPPKERPEGVVWPRR